MRRDDCKGPNEELRTKPGEASVPAVAGDPMWSKDLAESQVAVATAFPHLDNIRFPGIDGFYLKVARGEHKHATVRGSVQWPRSHEA